MRTNKNYSLSLVPIITLIVGFISFLSLSIYLKVFWVTSKYDVPLVYNVSVMIGDSILLPTINYKIFNLCLNHLGIESIKKNKKIIITWAFTALIISFILNLSTHLIWVNDELTDFIGFKKGKFSIIGYWHLVYSIFQMLILLLFPFFWLVAIRNKNNPGIKYSHNIWKLIFLFSTLGIFDMLNKIFFVYHNKTVIYAIEIDKFSFSTVILSFILLYIMKQIEIAHKKTPQGKT